MPDQVPAHRQVLLLSTYDLGRQPFGVASPLAWLSRAGVTAAAQDLSRDPLDPALVAGAHVVAFYLPMHTAARLAIPVIARVRALNPGARLCAYGLYAPLSEALLRQHGVTEIIGPEAEAALVALATRPDLHSPIPDVTAVPRGIATPRLTLITPERNTLPAPSRYAALRMPDGTRRIAGSTDASRGCKHRCRHCPIVPVYDGQFRVVPVDVVLQDIARQVAAGAAHISFGDPDFFNGPTHARRVVEALHQQHPAVTYDVTIKVEHLLAHRALLPLLARTGCLFVTSAVESFDPAVLEHLEKGHTPEDAIDAVSCCRDAGVNLVPTFVAFTPWTTLTSYAALLETVADLELIEHVSPVQWGLRLLVTEGSRLLELDDVKRRVGRFDPATLTYPWTHADPGVDALQRDVIRLVGVRLRGPRRPMFDAVAERAGLRFDRDPQVARAAIPYLDEPWYC